MPRWTTLTLSLGTIALTPACESGRVDVRDRLAQYATVRLEADTTGLTRADRMTVAYLIAAAAEMDTLFWDQAYGPYDSLLAPIRDPEVRRYVEMNYGPWDRLRENEPFLPGVGPKPAGANFYPADLTRAEFEAYVAAHPEQADSLKSLYTLVRRARMGRSAPCRTTKPTPCDCCWRRRTFARPPSSPGTRASTST